MSEVQAKLTINTAGFTAGVNQAANQAERRLAQVQAKAGASTGAAVANAAGLNKLGAVANTMTQLGQALSSAGGAAGALGAALTGLAATLGPIIVVAAAAVGVCKGLQKIMQAIGLTDTGSEQRKKQLEAEKQAADKAAAAWKAYDSELNSILSKLQQLNSSETMTNKALVEQEKLVKQLAAQFGITGLQIDQVTGRVKNLDKALAEAKSKEISHEIEKWTRQQREAQRQVADAQAHLAKYGVDPNDPDAVVNSDKAQKYRKRIGRWRGRLSAAQNSLDEANRRLAVLNPNENEVAAEIAAERRAALMDQRAKLSEAEKKRQTGQADKAYARAGYLEKQVINEKQIVSLNSKLQKIEYERMNRYNQFLNGKLSENDWLAIQNDLKQRGNKLEQRRDTLIERQRDLKQSISKLNAAESLDQQITDEARLVQLQGQSTSLMLEKLKLQKQMAAAGRQVTLAQIDNTPELAGIVARRVKDAEGNRVKDVLAAQTAAGNQAVNQLQIEQKIQAAMLAGDYQRVAVLQKQGELLAKNVRLSEEQIKNSQSFKSQNALRNYRAGLAANQSIGGLAGQIADQTAGMAGIRTSWRQRQADKIWEIQRATGRSLTRQQRGQIGYLFRQQARAESLKQTLNSGQSRIATDDLARRGGGRGAYVQTRNYQNNVLKTITAISNSVQNLYRDKMGMPKLIF